MEQIRRSLANIQDGLGQLGPTHKLLFGSLAVIALMTLFLVSQYAAKPTMVDLMSQQGDPQLVGALRAVGIEAEVSEGRVLVPSGTQHAALAHLSSSGQLPSDTTILFNNLIQSQDWKASREQHRQQAVIALQNELSRVISQIRGVREARVIIDAPESAGLGRAVREPSASVTVFGHGGAGIPQPTVDAIASLVAGSRAGLHPARVQVIDGSTGRPREVSSEESMASGMYMDHKRQVELYTQREIERLLVYVPGAVVTVNAVVDVTRVAMRADKYLEPKSGSVSILKSETTSEGSNTQGSRGAEPGLRSSSTADISQGRRASGQESEESTTNTENEIRIGSETTETVDPRGMPTYLSASVIIPREWIESLIRSSRPEDQAEDTITQAEADVYFEDSIKPTMEKTIKTRLSTVGPDGNMQDGVVEIAMAPMPAGMAGFSGGGGLMGVSGPGGGGGGGLFSASSLIETVVLGVLSLIALIMMLMLVRRAGKRPELPTAEELVGVPPALEIAGDMVGEAAEGDAPMAGIEISDDEVKIEKMREQVAELISSDPDGAATLVGRWIGDED
ncbi:MAG: flagellar M-ring protein FliF C-terminal domain-containing protein [Planctomycetota bacterium]